MGKQFPGKEYGRRWGKPRVRSPEVDYDKMLSVQVEAPVLIDPKAGPSSGPGKGKSDGVGNGKRKGTGKGLDEATEETHEQP